MKGFRFSRPSRAAAPAGAPVRWAVAGALLGGALTLVLCAPAHWLAVGIERATEGQLQLREARGTVWTGSARLVLSGGAGSRDALGLPSRVQWQLRPAWRGLRLRLETGCCTPQPLQARLLLHWQGVEAQVQDQQSQWPAGLLTGLGTPWNTAQIQGQLQLRTQGLRLEYVAGRWRSEGQVQLDALDLSTRLSTLRPMGSYRLVFDGGDAPRLTLSTLEGHLRLSGSGQWVGQRLRFTGEATATPEREAALTNFLNIIGRRSGARSIITLG
ncbi:type II secretion system protein N [Comamonas endophytica]|uniref:Type II secretion system protein N n=1 Tax=Comamonas endophytica TaxID=2949090 RepID=A0ABY6GCE8_9BURK|nr:MULTISPECIES: type II secretion system protein N [unclassified Acidovorax]MCD2512882.1 type II secretion system protein N [Acidovorax sp. D4N7]UYG52771.1 type II secretion system protein N [Acidovorax sp. 5MLIR]